MNGALHRGTFLARCCIAAVALATPALRAQLDPPAPAFTNVTVHDPSVVRDGAEFRVFGSHLASARSANLIQWTQISTGPTGGNPLFPNPAAELADALNWVDPNPGNPQAAHWAPDVIRLADGRYRFYYCVGRLDQPRAALGVAESNLIAGPYTEVAIMLRSGPGGQPAEAGPFYDATIHPNTVDPSVFFDQAGRFWMVYGSYSGGIFILELNPATGLQLPGQGYGKKLIGGNHARIEGAYIIYSPETEYYYLFVSFGGLAASGGYNIRVGRSRNPDGPYVDAVGTDLVNVKGAPGTLFDDASIAPHGVKLMGGYQFLHVAGENTLTSRGYLSPGHNSAYRDPDTGKYFLVFHTRFVGRGEQHEVRVHQMFMNSEGWPVVAPHRYAGESLGVADPARIPGSYKLINHGKSINSAPTTSSLITLHPDNTISGAVTGTWQLIGDYDVTLALSGVIYRGVFVRQWDDDNLTWVTAFTALSDNGTAWWGSKVATPEPPTIVVQPVVHTAVIGSRVTFCIAANGTGPLTYQWRRNGMDIAGATNATYVISTVEAWQGGNYSVFVSNSVGSVTSNGAALTIDPTPRLINVSCFASAGSGDSTLVAGFYINGTGSKTLLIRGIGPRLEEEPFLRTGLVADPRISVYDSDGVLIDTNNDWDSALAPDFDRVGAFGLANGSKDAALKITLAPGLYSVHLVNSSAIADGLIEVYDLSRDLGSRLTNVSSRLNMKAGETVILGTALIANPTPVLARAVGPGLEPYVLEPLSALLPDPFLRVYVGNDEIALNDDWALETKPYFKPSGAFTIADGSKDSAIRVVPTPGSLTIHATGNGGGTGIALIELYESP